MVGRSIGFNPSQFRITNMSAHSAISELPDYVTPEPSLQLPVAEASAAVQTVVPASQTIPNAAAIQECLGMWRGESNPRPTSVEVRNYIRQSATLFHLFLSFREEAVNVLLEVSPFVFTLAS